VAIRREASDYCPVTALGAAGIMRGAIFRRVVKGNKVTTDRLTDQSVASVQAAPGARGAPVVGAAGGREERC